MSKQAAEGGLGKNLIKQSEPCSSYSPPFRGSPGTERSLVYERSKQSVRPIANARERLQLVEPAAGTEAQLWSAGGDSDCLVIRHPSSWAAFVPSELPDM